MNESNLANDVADVRVAICIPTFMRPAGLSRLLHSIRQLEMPTTRSTAIEVIIVDNDADGTAREVVERERSSLGFPITYAIEPQRGISHVRNRLVSLSAHCDFLAFVDDDEHVSPEWLKSLMDVQHHTNAEIVLGPVLPDLAENTPQWIIDGRFFNWARYPTGTEVGSGETSTGVYKLANFSYAPEPFDLRFTHTGGEDTFLFMNVLKRGGTIRWCDEAVAYEVIPESRANLGWMLRRAYRMANSFTRCEYLAYPGATVRVKRLIKGLVWMAIGIAGLPVTLIKGRGFASRMLLHVCKGAGMVAGVGGHRYEEYRTVHGN